MNEMITTKSLTWIKFQLEDFSEFQNTVHSWGVDFYQLDNEAFYSELEQIIMPDIQIGHTHFNCHLDQKGHSPQGMWTFVILAEDSSMFNFNHVPTASTSTMLIYSPGQEILATTFPGFHIYVLSVEQQYLKDLTNNLGLYHIEEKLAQIDRIELDPEQSQHLREQLEYIIGHVASLDIKELSADEKALFTQYIPTLFLKEMHVKAGCSPKRVFKDKNLLFMQIRTYIHSNLSSPLLIEELAKKFNITERSLRNYFQHELHISPKEYIKVIRLRKVRENLLVLGQSQNTIEKIARKFGFTHMGRFSAAYQAFFDELPSETIKASKSNVIVSK